MQQYKRIEKQVKADQYYPYKLIEVPGFKNITQDLYNQNTLKTHTVCTHAHIETSEGLLEVFPGEWVVVSGNQIQIKSNKEFLEDFALI